MADDESWTKRFSLAEQGTHESNFFLKHKSFPYVCECECMHTCVYERESRKSG